MAPCFDGVPESCPAIGTGTSESQHHDLATDDLADVPVRNSVELPRAGRTTSIRGVDPPHATSFQFTSRVIHEPAPAGLPPDIGRYGATVGAAGTVSISIIFVSPSQRPSAAAMPAGVTAR